MGYFSSTRRLFTSDKDKVESFRLIHRWRLEPKDTAAYQRGELVEPVEPIIFYVDNAFPEKWRSRVLICTTTLPVCTATQNGLSKRKRRLYGLNGMKHRNVSMRLKKPSCRIPAQPLSLPQNSKPNKSPKRQPQRKKQKTFPNPPRM